MLILCLEEMLRDHICELRDVLRVCKVGVVYLMCVIFLNQGGSHGPEMSESLFDSLIDLHDRAVGLLPVLVDLHLLHELDKVALLEAQVGLPRLKPGLTFVLHLMVPPLASV